MIILGILITVLRELSPSGNGVRCLISSPRHCLMLLLSSVILTLAHSFPYMNIYLLLSLLIFTYFTFALKYVHEVTKMPETKAVLHEESIIVSHYIIAIVITLYNDNRNSCPMLRCMCASNFSDFY